MPDLLSRWSSILVTVGKVVIVFVDEIPLSAWDNGTMDVEGEGKAETMSLTGTG